MTKRARDLRSVIIADWPPGRFDGAMPLLHQFCELATRPWRPLPISPLAAYCAALDAEIEVTCELLDLAEALGLLPGESRCRLAPRLQ